MIIQTGLKYVYKIIIVLFLLQLFPVAIAQSQDENEDVDTFYIPGRATLGTEKEMIKAIDSTYEDKFRNVKGFFIVVGIDCDTSLWLSKEIITDYAKLRFRNNFADIPILDLKNAIKIVEIYSSDEMGLILIHVWAVGNDYPIAWHISFKVSTLEDFTRYVYKQAGLGYISKYNILDSIKQQIDQMTEEFATIFFKAQGKL